MIYNGREVEFPAIMQVSFFKLIAQLEDQAKSPDAGLAGYARELLAEVEKHPELREGISDVTRLKDYQLSIEKLAKPLFPEVLTSNEIKILTPPFYFEPMYASQRFRRIIEASGEPFNFTMKDVDEDTFYLYCCYYILSSYYGYSTGGAVPQFFEVDNTTQGIRRIYKLLINADMSEFIPTEKALEITREDYEELMDNFDDIELWKKKFPPDSWIMRGLNILNLVDVTSDQSINAITSNLLVYEPNSFERIKGNIRKMLNDASLHVGVINYENGHLQSLPNSAVESLLLKEKESMHEATDLCLDVYETLLKRKEPLIITDSEKACNSSSSEFFNRLSASGFGSYAITPVVHEGEMLGFLEIGSNKRYQLHKGSLMILEKVMPILAVAKKRFQTEAQNLVEAIIQKECTTIHSSVKWRFEDEARAFMEKQMAGESPVFDDIVFEQLYPLYGQLDIKGSSERRNEAVRADLITQLKEVRKILLAANQQQRMPVYEESLFRMNGFIEELGEHLAAGSEHRILSFLKDDVYPILEYLLNNDTELRDQIQAYFDLLDEDLKTLYVERKKYDTSVNYINQHLATYIDNRQHEAQKMYPHYFERYKTDGVEFNMYIGQSISKDRVFDPIFLRNLRLWQLLVMCEMEKEFNQVKKELDSDIEVASLILVYNTPISVHFRMDEKQFDVEGAYNARYEIIKKRVDKAKIKGTNERITRPGSLVIVYSQEQDAIAYRTYLQFLASRGYLEEHVEDLALEDLQGVHGLRALRVDVTYSSASLSIDDFIGELQEDIN